MRREGFICFDQGFRGRVVRRGFFFRSVVFIVSLQVYRVSGFLVFLVSSGEAACFGFICGFLDFRSWVLGVFFFTFAFSFLVFVVFVFVKICIFVFGSFFFYLGGFSGRGRCDLFLNLVQGMFEVKGIFLKYFGMFVCFL